MVAFHNIVQDSTVKILAMNTTFKNKIHVHSEMLILWFVLYMCYNWTYKWWCRYVSEETSYYKILKKKKLQTDL